MVDGVSNTDQPAPHEVKPQVKLKNRAAIP